MRTGTHRHFVLMLVSITACFSVVGQTYNWTGFVTTTNSSTNTFVNGNMTAVVSATPGSGGQTAYSNGNTTQLGGSGECAGNPTGLYLEMSGASVAWGNSINVAITFATPVCGPVTFSIYEINYDIWNDGVDDWALFYDQITLSGTDNAAAPIAPANIVLGGCATAGNTSVVGNNKILRAGTFPSDVCECAAATVSIGAGQSVKTINILYNNTNPPPAPIDGKYGICQWQYTIVSPIVASGPPPLTITPVIPVCGGTAATLTATPGFSSYTWTTSAPGTIASPNTQSTGVNGYSTYTVTATFGSCPASVTSYVFNAAAASTPPSVGTMTGGSIYCAGGTTTVSTTATGVTYSWAGPGIVSGGTTATPTVNATGTYTVTITSTTNNCTATGSANVTLLPMPTVTISLTCGASACSRYQFTSSVVPAVPGATYQWQQSSSPSSANPPTGFTNLAGQTGVNFTGGNGGFLCGNPNVTAKWIHLQVTIPGCPPIYSTTSIFTQNTNPNCALVVLPVELTAFEISCHTGHKTAKWTTASEFNNDYFTLEHSKNGTEFTALLRVEGADNSVSPLHYSASINDEGYTYYRLKQTDFNGESSYSEIIYANCGMKNQQPVVSVYPNPVSNEIFISGLESFDETVSIDILDASGRVVRSITQVQFEGADMRVSTEGIPGGVYFIRVTGIKSRITLPAAKCIKNTVE